MGHYGSGLARRESEDLFKLKLTVLIVVLLIGQGSAQAFDFSNWFTEAAVAISADPRSGKAAVGTRERRVSSTNLDEGALVLEDELSRRTLRGHSTFYIGYGALTAGYTPCPPQSGRSYYTPRCHSATGAVRPYHRGCSDIAGCARR